MSNKSYILDFIEKKYTNNDIFKLYCNEYESSVSLETFSANKKDILGNLIIHCKTIVSTNNKDFFPFYFEYNKCFDTKNLLYYKFKDKYPELYLFINGKKIYYDIDIIDVSCPPSKISFYIQERQLIKYTKFTRFEIMEI